MHRRTQGLFVAALLIALVAVGHAVAKYKGSGSTDDPANFSCSASF